MSESQGKLSIIKVAAWLFVIVMVFYLLIVGQRFLIPILVAIFIWNLLNTLNDGIKRLPKVGVFLPNAISRLLSLLVVAGLIFMLVNIIGDNVTDVMGASARYQHNLKQILSQVNQKDLAKFASGFDQFLGELNLQGIILGVYSMFTRIAGSAVIIGLYIVFLFVEQRVVQQKFSILFPQAEHRQLMDSMILHIGKDVQAYLGLKSLMGLLTAVASWGIMKAVGLDFAEFWALLIFFLIIFPTLVPSLQRCFLLYWP